MFLQKQSEGKPNLIVKI